MSELPTTWEATPLSRVCERIVDGSHNPPKAALAGYPMLSARNIQYRKINFGDYRLISEDDFQIEHQRTAIRSGDVLMTIVGTIGRTAVVSDDIKPFALQRSVAVLRAEAINSQYLSYALEAPLIQKLLADNAKGTAQKGVYLKTLGTIEIPLAPLPEQKRIADKLDTVLARVDACRDRLDRLPALLKRFRQSILAAATSGRLTDDWRRSNAPANDTRRSAVLLDQIFQEQLAVKSGNRGGKIEPQLSDLPDEIDLPDSWQVAGFDALAAPERNALKAGPFGSALKKSMYVPSGYKIYGQEQVISGDENFGDYYIDADKFQELSSCAVKSGDILISLVGTIGRVLILSEHAKLGIINPRLVKLSLHTAVSRTYIAMYLASPIAQHFFAKQSHGGTMDILNLGILRELPILFPPPEEQTEIVRRVEILFAFADRLEARLSAARKQVEQLTPALLAKAFRGELVPQDPADEPASELLKRLAAAGKDSPPKARRGKVRAGA